MEAKRLANDNFVIFDDGTPSTGKPTAELVDASAGVDDTGLVSAYFDGDMWQYVAPCDVDRLRSLGETVVTVYIES